MIIYLIGAAVTFIILCLSAGWEKSKDNSMSDEVRALTVVIGTILWPGTIIAIIGLQIFSFGKWLNKKLTKT